MQKHYYVMMNQYASETSDGFANTWFAVRFDTAAERQSAIRQGILAARMAFPSERYACRQCFFSSHLEEMDSWTRRF